jgi:hypothetical protein
VGKQTSSFFVGKHAQPFLWENKLPAFFGGGKTRFQPFLWANTLPAFFVGKHTSSLFGGKTHSQPGLWEITLPAFFWWKTHF